MFNDEVYDSEFRTPVIARTRGGPNPTKASFTHKPGALWECSLSEEIGQVFTLLSKVLEELKGSGSQSTRVHPVLLLLKPPS